MKTQVTLLIVKILLQPSVALEVDKDCLMPWQPLSVNPAALYLQGLEANPFEKGPQMPLGSLELDIPQHQPGIVIPHGTGALHGSSEEPQMLPLTFDLSTC